MTTPRDDISGLSESEPTKEQVAACERAMDGLDAQADIWAEEIALVNIVKNLGEVSRGLKDRMPTDVREGFINRQEAQIDALIRQAYSEGFYRGGESRKEYDAAHYATQFDSLLKERDALEARVKELEQDFAKLTDMAKESEALRKNALAVAEQWQSRATSLQQERDEAYERAEGVANATMLKFDDMLNTSSVAQSHQERECAVLCAMTAREIADAIRRLPVRS